MIHYHGCPECHEKWPCDMDCTIEPDFHDPIYHPDKQFGSYCICFMCESKNPTAEWFDKYNGIIK